MRSRSSQRTMFAAKALTVAQARLRPAPGPPGRPAPPRSNRMRPWARVARRAGAVLKRARSLAPSTRSGREKLFKSLGGAQVHKVLLQIAHMTGNKSGDQKKDRIKGLLVASKGQEAQYIVRHLQARPGLAPRRGRPPAATDGRARRAAGIRLRRSSARAHGPSRPLCAGQAAHRPRGAIGARRARACGVPIAAGRRTAARGRRRAEGSPRARGRDHEGGLTPPRPASRRPCPRMKRRTTRRATCRTRCSERSGR